MTNGHNEGELPDQIREEIQAETEVETTVDFDSLTAEEQVALQSSAASVQELVEVMQQAKAGA